MTHPLFSDPNNSVAFVPETETSLSGPGPEDRTRTELEFLNNLPWELGTE